MDFNAVNQFIKDITGNNPGTGTGAVDAGHGAREGGSHSGKRVRNVESRHKGRAKHQNRRESAADDGERDSRRTIATRKRQAEDWISDKAPAVLSSGGSENEGLPLMSIPERKREREKRRREGLNLKFNELALMLPRSANGKLDKEGILIEAMDNLKRLNKVIMELNMQNQNLKSEIDEVRQEKAELRTDKTYVRAELDSAREEIKTLKADHLILWQKLRQQVNDSMGIARSSNPSDPMLEVALRTKLIGVGNRSEELQELNNVDTSKITSHNECA
eukprot:CAMPEP_0184751856 /NCGR_PEP_ID=MMETSP0315-20130426/43272_1 /TAXON_ID=101924 /ORGANISM="Rhodosorus marinus, Strain UTEX LB 2760" /LENGTH=275 /DNA_ID=CAMNT_0027231155 /DNA_START=99 /DNA_END=926 /DNA_ORIENTATION=+